MPWWATLIASLLTAALSGGGVARFLLVRRESDKIAAEADSIEANVTDLNWKRMQRKIDRLAKRVEAGERRITELEDHLSTCQRERAILESENIKLKAAADARGEVRQRVAQIVAVDRLEGER